MTSRNDGDQVLRIGVTFPPAGGGPGPTKIGASISPESTAEIRPSPLQIDQALQKLSQLGFVVTARGRVTAAIRGSAASYERLTGTTLVRRTDPEESSQFQSYLVDSDEPHRLDPVIADLIDDVFVHPPHLYLPSLVWHQQDRKHRQKKASLGAANAKTPKPVEPVIRAFHISVPDDLRDRFNARRVHDRGHKGEGITVAVIDSGFDRSHPFFLDNEFSMNVVLAPHATDVTKDGNGHGTGIAANVFSIAPKVNFLGIKLDNEDVATKGASLHEGFLKALEFAPRVISLSVGHNLVNSDGTPMATLPGYLTQLQTAIADAVARGIVVVAAAGNGHFSYPAQMPGVIAVGGAYIDEAKQLTASDFASAYTSLIHSGRSVPDVCGLVGEVATNGAYIAMPVPSECVTDRRNARDNDGTAEDDGWSVFSGTSSATPQVAAVCALLLQKNGALTPKQVRAALVRSAVDVKTGTSNAATGGILAGRGTDGATGAGLVDAYEAWKVV